MKKIIISENQKGFLFRGGRLVKLLNAGVYRVFGGREIEVVSIAQPLASRRCDLDTLLANPQIARLASVVEVDDQRLALHFVGGRFAGALTRGRHAFWTGRDRHDYRMVDLSVPEVAQEIPAYIFPLLSTSLYKRVEVAPYQQGLLMLDGKLSRTLDAGTYFFWNGAARVEVLLTDMRVKQMDVNGQEIMTKDKVTLRVNFVCRYRVTDCVRIYTDIGDADEQLHVACQLALREYVGGRTLDELLAGREEMSRWVLERLKARESELFVDIADAGVKDLILPGEIRDIMNTVLVAEKRAQANVITRREEVASTRSLLNTAKLMEENQTLYKLKELEHIERVCEHVGSISLNGSGDVLSLLSRLTHGENPAAQA